ncbi:class I SAM-dependent methyltransferase [Legionella oakridgensis]|uniref:Ribosomal RNA small subunit methyltransferase J n=2 Tax=Legionella oakridgensis TaxID=29423 RepID=W0BD57_9GAMM|nr:class I SAM-dependent methyltransferase [Legionella oakridgensis]AHE67775.1 N6-adenine-specific methylase [Legionella oakridgensis ATCC 33761 = DSM 21215]ETO92676.1 N6-adenine-specific methylase [Legionella oakridgensis RV-2-2007]KTD36900.1 SAM-dependent methyltransferase [Legionella oakridgensis]STY20791.1 N6-adenine-specific methylase [Legionella longbeachae]
MKSLLTIGFDHEGLYEQTKSLAERLALRVDNQCLPRLQVTAERLELLVEGFSPLYADFSTANWQRRHAAGKHQGLVRACKPAKGMTIFDVTAGWGRDAAILASFGACVVMIERNPVMAALLADGLKRLNAQSPRALCLSLLSMDARQYLQTLAIEAYPDVIYMDPMHPHRQKSALVKKEMQTLQQMIGADEDAVELLHLAKSCARQRVVVKWPQRIPPLLTPAGSIEGKTVRFDIYS